MNPSALVDTRVIYYGDNIDQLAIRVVSNRSIGVSEVRA